RSAGNLAHSWMEGSDPGSLSAHRRARRGERAERATMDRLAGLRRLAVARDRVRAVTSYVRALWRPRASLPARIDAIADPGISAAAFVTHRASRRSGGSGADASG